jgi:hypothetical protein
MNGAWLTAQERLELQAEGRDPVEVERQLALLAGPPPSTRLVRPATVGDGILLLDPSQFEALEQQAARVAAEGRVSAFVPASGAATRLCQALVRAQAGEALSRSEAAQVERIVAHACALALWPALVAAGARGGDRASILGALVGPSGLGLQRWPKGLVPFHAGEMGGRTAFEEHLVESAQLATDRHERLRKNFTVSSEHLGGFRDVLARHLETLPTPVREGLQVDFSVQDPRTDTIAGAPGGGPFRDASGRLVFRPGGHGALLTNLEGCGGDLVLIKNIDNVVPDPLRAEVVRWRRRLLGLLAQTQAEAWSLAEALAGGQGSGRAQAFVERTLGLQIEDPEALRARLLRPWRVAGMVRNSGQPGGGPFWAESPDGVSLQIVEGAQVAADPDQQAILGSSTHFNPVDLVVGLRGPDGEPLSLGPWTDPSAVIVTHKSVDGRTAVALEHPGLWNGGMARWNTVFVEIPASTFQPVKTLDDLLLAAHGGPLGDGLA